ncbi:MAG: transporter substrate-binding domain-containing protein [Propionivibrio sp.]
MRLRLRARFVCRMLALAALATLLSLLGAAARAAGQDPTAIRIATGEWPPYTSEKLDGHGIACKLITEAFAAVGVKVTYVFYPWNRSLELARRGGIDATATWFESADRRAGFHLSDPLFDSRFLLYYLKEKPVVWQSIDDLNGLKIGATTGYFYGEAFAHAETAREITVIRASSDEINLKNLLLGRLDAFPLDQQVAEFLLANDLPAVDAARIGSNAIALYSRPQLLLISRRAANGEALIRLFNRGLDTIRGNGVYERIVHDAALATPSR